jgi:MSHA biogenesis protein MshI
MFAFSPVRRRPGWLAILPQGERIALAHVLRGPAARPEVRLLESFAVEAGELEALQRLRLARQLKAYACTTLMPAGEYHIAQLDAPNVPAEERKEAVRWALKGMVDYPLETACVDVLDIPTQGAGRQAAVFAVSAAEDRVRARAGLFDAAKIPLLSIDIAELAQRNVAALLEEDNRGLAFLSLDEAGGLLTLTFHGELIAMRRVDVSAVQLSGSDLARREQLLERLVLELQRSLDNFDRQYGFISISKLILAMDPPVAGLAAALGENIYVPVQEMDLSAVMDFPAVPELRDPRCQARNLLVIGAALRAGEVAA